MEKRDANTQRIWRGPGYGRAAARALLAPVLLLLVQALLAPGAQAAFGFKTATLSFSEEGAGPAVQAGSHPFELSAGFGLNTLGAPPEEVPDGLVKDLRIQLPPGLVGTADLLPHCSHADFIAQSCPSATEVGTIELHSSATEGEFPVYNLEPLPGNAAELAFIAKVVPIAIDLQIAIRPPYNLIAEMTDITQATHFFGATLTLEGVPGSSPLLTLPRSCGPAPATFEADSWADPGAWVGAQPADQLTPIGCGKLPFSPALTAEPTTQTAGAPAGLDLTLDSPDEGIASPAGIAHADLAGVTLDLPTGMTLNPSIATRLAACAPAELARETATSAPGEGCPQAAKVGTAAVTTPLLDEAVKGTLFVAQPDDPTTAQPGAENPFDARFAVYLVLRNAERGILVTVPIEIAADPASGQVRAILRQLPQLPIDHLELHFNSGPHAPLTTPRCGNHAISFSLSPSSGARPLSGAAPFTVDAGCPVAAFDPAFSAGTTSNAAGRAAPFVFELGSGPDEANPTSLDFSLPPGLSASFASTAVCPEAATATADCPSGSRLGHARIALGPGSEPLWIPEEGKAPSAVYLAGPYQGGPYSLLVKVRAEAGPFDLGTVVLRAGLQIDPGTAQASVLLEHLPQILAGVPLQYRTIRLVLDRPGFIHNPTSCEPMRSELSATAADGTVAAVSSPFQASDCARLGFRPRLRFRFSGGLGRNAHPQIQVRLSARPGDANISAAAIDLPAGELLDTRRIPPLCPRDLAPSRCPAASRLGRAVLSSPLLPEPLRGPIFLRTPDRRYFGLLADLRGGDLHLFLHGRAASRRGGHFRVLLGGLPDLPLSRATITLPGGRQGLVVNSASLCARPRRVGVLLSGQNGKRLHLRPRTLLGGRC